jgi:predicted enzyme related to lactoylglutathione lyase
MKRVTALGGVFFKCNDPGKMRDWYHKHLGLETDEYGTSFGWRHFGNSEKKGYTAWSPFDKETSYFEPSKKDFMINYRVENLSELLNELAKEGVEIIGEISSYDYGKFAHIIDPEGNKIELWEPDDKKYGEMVTAVTK